MTGKMTKHTVFSEGELTQNSMRIDSIEVTQDTMEKKIVFRDYGQIEGRNVDDGAGVPIQKGRVDGRPSQGPLQAA